MGRGVGGTSEPAGAAALLLRAQAGTLLLPAVPRAKALVVIDAGCS